MKNKEIKSIMKERYKLNTLSLKLITIIIFDLNENKDEVINIKELSNLLIKSYGSFYTDLNTSVEELLTKGIYIKTETGAIRRNWFTYSKRSKGHISFRISSKLRPYLLEVKEKFLKYKLENILHLNSAYSIGLFELLKDEQNLVERYNKKPIYEISLIDFCEQLSIPESYRFFDIKRQILEKSQKEIKEKTDISFQYEVIKNGRKVVGLRFFINADEEVLDFNSIKSFIRYIRKQYSGTGKFFMAGKLDDKNCWYGINKKGLLYGHTDNGNIIFNKTESQERYNKFFKIVSKSEVFKDFIINSKNLQDVLMYDRELFDKIIAEAVLALE